MELSPQRCTWVNSDPLYISYHDNEWGKEMRDNHALFEMLCLEGQQAGLSWYTVLKKRLNYRALFYQFDPSAIAKMDDHDVERLMLEAGIIRHRGKINAIITNAKAYLQMLEQQEDFSQFIWQFVDNTPITNNWLSSAEVPVTTPISDALSKALKKRGFKFIGTTTCYAFMQATGMVNDHLTHCHYNQN